MHLPRSAFVYFSQWKSKRHKCRFKKYEWLNKQSILQNLKHTYHIFSNKSLGIYSKQGVYSRRALIKFSYQLLPHVSYVRERTWRKNERAFINAWMPHMGDKLTAKIDEKSLNNSGPKVPQVLYQTSAFQWFDIWSVHHVVRNTSYFSRDLNHP